MAIRIVQVGIADPRNGHAELDRLEAEGFSHESTILGRDGAAAIVTMRQGPQTARDKALQLLADAMACHPMEFVNCAAALRRGEAVEWGDNEDRKTVLDAMAACLDCIVGDGLDMRIVDPRAVVEAPSPVAAPAPPPFVLNTDELLRAACFDAWDQEGDEPVRFRANVKGLRALVDGMFVTGDESHAGDGSVATPTLREFLRFGDSRWRCSRALRSRPRTDRATLLLTA